jgi:hypothetical protein
LKCSLCGFDLNINEREACRGCSLAVSCGMVRCTNCGYEMPQEAKLLRLFKRWRKKQSEDK